MKFLNLNLSQIILLSNKKQNVSLQRSNFKVSIFNSSKEKFNKTLFRILSQLILLQKTHKINTLQLIMKYLRQNIQIQKRLKLKTMKFHIIQEKKCIIQALELEIIKGNFPILHLTLKTKDLFIPVLMNLYVCSFRIQKDHLYNLQESINKKLTKL